MSTPRPFFGRSLIWPTEAMTLKSLPRYLLIVFAFDGDSTITSDLDITHSNATFCQQYRRAYQHGKLNHSSQKANQIPRTWYEVQAGVKRELRGGAIRWH